MNKKQLKQQIHDLQVENNLLKELLLQRTPYWYPWAYSTKNTKSYTPQQWQFTHTNDPESWSNIIAPQTT